MLKRLFTFQISLLTLLLICQGPLLAQQEINWGMLSRVTFEETYHQEYGTTFLKPDYAKSVEKLEGEEIAIIGYLLPLDVENDQFILSKSPFASCFFCGKGGPETVMELRLIKKEKWFEMDQLILFKGRLRLNREDPELLYYILEEASAVERMDK